MTLVSIIIPFYNVSEHIEHCAKSLFEQTYKNIEYIFIDDASTDTSLNRLINFIETYPNKNIDYHIVRHEQNTGPSKSRNEGLYLSKGEYITFCDGDDWLEPQMIERLLTEAIRNSADVVISDFNIVSKDSTQYYSVPDTSLGRIAFINNYINSRWTVVWNIMAKKSLISLNGISFPENIKFCEDFVFSVELLFRSNKIINVRQPLYNYNRLNSSSITRNYDKMNDELIAYLNTVIFFETHKTLDKYEKVLSWRILKCTQDLLLSKQTLSDFIGHFPRCHKYIFSCPYTKYKMKLLMWTATHHLKIINYAYLSLKSLFHN